MATSAITAATADDGDVRWVAAAVLRALAERGIAKGQQFTSNDLRAWVPGLKVRAKLKHANATLIASGFVNHNMHVVGATSMGRYTLTAAGLEAVKAAAAGQQLRSGPKGPHSVDRTVGEGTFAARLWRLLRARQMLDTGTAAETLVDAGSDDSAVDRAAKTAQRYLARWASTGAVKESAQRLANGRKRYVLITDTPNPPAWTPKAKARSAQNRKGDTE